MKIAIVPALAALLLATGCESTPHYNRTQVAVTGQTYPKKPYGTVALFQKKEDVPRGYDIIATMTVDGNPNDEAAFTKAFLYHAADLGADGLIFYHQGTTVTTPPPGVVYAPYGFMAGGPSVNASYKGEAIHYK